MPSPGPQRAIGTHGPDPSGHHAVAGAARTTTIGDCRGNGEIACGYVSVGEASALGDKGDDSEEGDTTPRRIPFVTSVAQPRVSFAARH
jgi:hypothetical protein